MKNYNNPIIRGFNPDPSICAIGDDFYIVTSTFEFFPGVPIYHSKNLVNWECIGHCLTREEQLKLQDCRNSGGIYAPSIRHHDGIFYMITTNVCDKGNFIVYTDDIRGEWSNPVWIEHKGIDPSLFFDDDGKVYYTGTVVEDDGRHGITLFEINPKTGEVLSDKKTISYGLTGRHPEAPHLYKKDGYYYLMVAEGGTEYGHMENIFRSKDIAGPYESCPHNPILSNRYAMTTNIACTGHADIAQDTNGNWWMCFLAVRRFDKAMLHNLGRETFLAPVKWVDGWPVVITENGVITEQMQGDLPGEEPTKVNFDFSDDFSGCKLKNNWNFVRNPDMAEYNLADGKLTLESKNKTLVDYAPTFVGVRQSEFCMEVKTKLDLAELSLNGKAGISAYYSKDNHFAISVRKTASGYEAVLNRVVFVMNCEEITLPLGNVEDVVLEIETGQDEYKFYVTAENKRQYIGSGNTAALCTEGTATMTFTGTYIGLFAENTKASFDSFSMKAN